MLEEISQILSKPFTTDLSFKVMGLAFILFVVIAILAIDTLNILKEGMN